MPVKTRTQTRKDSASEFDETKSSLFLNLPSNIRFEIYKYALTAPTPIALHGPHHIPAPGLVQVNRQTRNKAQEVLYGCNEFEYGALYGGLLPTRATHLRLLVRKVVWDYNRDEIFLRRMARERALRGNFKLFKWIKDCLVPSGFVNILTVRLDELAHDV